MSTVRQRTKKPAFHFWLLSVFLALVFLTGGTSRADAQSLIILRPVSISVCALAIITLHRNHLEQRAWLLVGFLALATIAALHMLPLPPQLLHNLAGRGEIYAVDAAIASTDMWRPLNIAPLGGWNALASLFAPLAVILLAVQLSRSDLYRILPVLIGLGALSGLFGLLQAIGSAESPLYLYRLTNNGSAVGLFANRNHAATLLGCLFPMLAVFASTAEGTTESQNRLQLWVAAFAIVLVPLILVTGSRSGLISAMVGLAGAAFIYRCPSPGRAVRRHGARISIGAAPILAGLAVLCLGLVTVLFSRAEAIDRLFPGASIQDNRADFWTASLNMLFKNSIFGSGSGSFAEAYRIAEPSYLLDSTYLNHAHNDWIETATTFGFPFILFLSIALLVYLRRFLKIAREMDGKRRSVAFSRMAGLNIAIIAAASFTDYPLRTPTMMCVLAVFVLWFVEAGRGASEFSDNGNKA